jgi:hypothetical protein
MSGNISAPGDRQMALRWCAAGMIEQASSSRRVNGPAAILIGDSPVGSKNKNLIRTRDGRERSTSAHNHPGPDNETNWLAAPTVRAITAYQRVGWLAKKAKPVKAQPIPRKTLERRAPFSR